MRMTGGPRTRIRLASMLSVLMLVLLAGSASVTTARVQHPGIRGVAHGRGTGLIWTLDMKSPSPGWGWGPTLVTHTADGAERLVDVTPVGIDRSHPVQAETALDALHAWIVTGSSTQSGTFRVYRTQNGGATWSSTIISAQQAGDITFVDTRHGWMQASRLIDHHRINRVTLSRTIDGGATWSSIYQTRRRITIQPNMQAGDCQWSLVQFTTPLQGVVGVSCDKTASVEIARTHDGGRTWHRLTLPALRRPPGTVLWSGVGSLSLSTSSGSAFITLCVGDQRSCTYYGTVYRTGDGGRTWSAGQKVVRPRESVVFAGPAHIWLPYGCLTRCDSAPQILRTSDAGAHWTSMRLPAALASNMHGSRQFQFVSPSVGFAVAGDEFAPQTRFFRTTDGGHSFHRFMPRMVRS